MFGLAPALPLAVVVAALGLRAGALTAGLGGLTVTALVAVATGRLGPEAAAIAAGRGVWIALHAVVVIAAGLFFQTARAGLRPRPAGPDRGLGPFGIVFGLGTFAECATGFGVGYIVAFGALRARGLPPLPAVVLGMFSQVLVPWGALGVGTKVGALLIGLAPDDLGLASAWITGPLLLAAFFAFEVLCRRMGVTRNRRETAEDGVWLAILAALLVVLSHCLPFDVVGLLAAGLLLAMRHGRDARPAVGDLARVLRANWDYVALVIGLLAMRLVPALIATTRSHLVLDPGAGLPPLYVLSNPASWLAGLAVRNGDPRRAASATAARAWRPVLFTVLFVAMAGLYAAAGLARDGAVAVGVLLGPLAPALTPFAAAFAGFLTASNAGSNALTMPIAAAMASGMGPGGLLFLAGVQNAVGSAFTMLSPARVSMGVGLAEGAVRESDLARPGAIITAALLGMAVIVVVVRLAAS